MHAVYIHCGGMIHAMYMHEHAHTECVYTHPWDGIDYGSREILRDFAWETCRH